MAYRRFPIAPAWVKTLGKILDEPKPVQIMALCSRCSEQVPVDVPALAEKVGRDYSLMNRRSPCRQQDCTGWYRFKYSTGTWTYPLWDEKTDQRWLMEDRPSKVLPCSTRS